MSDIDDMTLFVRIADLGSLSAAGRELRLSTALASHRLGRLEDRHGVSLLNRTTRRVALTEEGQVFYDYCQQVLAATERFEDRISVQRQEISGLIRVNAPTMLGRHCLAGLLSAFQKIHPACEIRFSLNDEYIDPVTGDADLLIRTGGSPDSSLVARRLGRETRCLVASPEYLQIRGRPQNLADLEQHNCLLLRFPGSRQFRWAFTMDGQDRQLALSGNMDSDDPEILLTWAKAGRGLALLPQWRLARALEAGQLTRVPMHDAEPTTPDVSLLWAPNRFHPPRFRALADYLADHLPLFLAAPGKD